MNRILRPGGYFILSTMHDSIEEEEGLAPVYHLVLKLMMLNGKT